MFNMIGFEAITLAIPYVRTSSGNSDALDLDQFFGPIKIVVSAYRSSDDGKSIAFKLQHSANNSSWSDVTDGGFGAIANIDATVTKPFGRGELSRYIRLAWTIGGISPTGASFGVVLARKKKVTQDEFKYGAIVQNAPGDVFGFTWKSSGNRDVIKFSKVTAGRVNVMSNASYVITVNRASSGSNLTGSDLAISEKTVTGFCFMSPGAGELYEFMIVGTVTS